MGSNLGYLFAAFAVVWVGIFGFVGRLSLRQRRLEKEIESLERRIDDDE